MNNPIRPNFEDDTMPLSASMLELENWLFGGLDDDVPTDACEAVTLAQEIESVSWTSSSELVKKGVEASDALSSLDSDEDSEDNNIHTDQSKKIDVKYNDRPVGNDQGLPPHEQNSDANCKDQDRKRQASSSPPPTPPCSRRRKKEQGKPKRPLSAYNFFFQKERRTVLQDGDSSDKSKNVGFENLAKIIGKRWARLKKEDHKEFEELAHKDSIRYRKEMKKFNSAKHISSPEQYGLTAPSHIGSPSFQFANTPVSFGNSNTPLPFPSQFSGPPSLISADYGPSPPLYPPFSELPQQQQQQVLRTIMQHQIALQQATQHRTNNSSFPQGNQLPHQQQQQQQQQQQPGAYAPKPASAGPQQHYGQPSPYAPQPAPTGDTATPTKAMDPLRHPQAFPIPQGTEIILSDQNGVPRKYTVQYSLYSMKRDDAAKYMERLATAFQQVPVERAAAEEKQLPIKIAPRPATEVKYIVH
jgi:hypothetical protein